MSYTITVIFAILCIIGIFASVYLMYSAMARKNRKTAEDSIFLTNRRANYSKWINLYATFENFGPTSKFIKRLCEQFAILAPDDERFVKEKTIKTAITLWLITIAVLFVIIILKPTLYLFMLAALTMFVLCAQYVSSRLEKYNRMILVQFIKLISEVRSAFFRHGMVDEAIYESIPLLPSLMQTHALKMYHVLTDDDVDEEVFRYLDTTPNIYMKRFISMCATTLKYGDAVVDGQSAFVNNIKNLQNDVYSHIYRKKNEDIKFKSLVAIAVVPVYTLMLIQGWAVSVIAETEPFYKGRWGILFTVGIFIVTILSYRKVVALRSSKLADTMEHPLLAYLESRGMIASMLNSYESRNYGKMLNLKNLLRRTGSSITNKQFVLQALCTSIAIALLAIVSFAGAEIATKQQSVTVFTDMSDKAMGSSEEINLMILALTIHYTEQFKDVDWTVWYNEYTGLNIAESSSPDEAVEEAFASWLLTSLKESGTPISEETLMKAIKQYNSQHSDNTKLSTLYYGTTGELPEEISDRERRKAENKKDEIMEALYDKECLDTDVSYSAVSTGIKKHVDDYQNAYFKWYYLLVALIAAVAVYFNKFRALSANEKELQMFMQEEIIQLQSILLALRPIDRISQYEMLENLVTFSTVFKSSLQKCYNSIDTDEMAAYEQILEEEPFEPFQRIIKNLMAVDRIGVKQAFNDLEVEIRNAIEEFNQDSDIRLGERAAVASKISYIPLNCTIGGYLVLPIVIKSMEKMTASLTTLMQ